MSTPALKPRPSAGRMTTRVAGSRAERVERVGEVEPALHRQRVDRRVVHDDLGDAGVVAAVADGA